MSGSQASFSCYCNLINTSISFLAGSPVTYSHTHITPFEGLLVDSALHLVCCYNLDLMLILPFWYLDSSKETVHLGWQQYIKRWLLRKKRKNSQRQTWRGLPFSRRWVTFQLETNINRPAPVSFICFVHAYAIIKLLVNFFLNTSFYSVILYVLTLVIKKNLIHHRLPVFDIGQHC